jgi:uncharacterized repeat protein (TIGR01451 family)
MSEPSVPAARTVAKDFSARTTPADVAILASQGPQLRIETTGPSSVLVNKEATYVIVITNEGNIPARGVLLRVGLPDHARAIAEGAVPDTGAAYDMNQGQRLVWSIAQIPPRGSERVTLRVVPTQNEAIAMSVDWTTRPVATHAEITVLQPRLELSVAGPREILFGDTAVYTIRLSNPGTGEASDVTVEFGYGADRLEPKRVGNLAPGQQTELKVELNAREAGAIEVLAEAKADGGLHANSRQQVQVRRANLDIQVVGDPAAFAGSVASYNVLVRNTGDAPATNVQASVNLPPGAKLVSGEGVKPAGNGLGFDFGTLAPNTERRLTLQCELHHAGDNQLTVRVAGANHQETSHTCTTKVETLADLKLTINDPSGPVAVNKVAAYELHIVNRGSKAATKVNVVAQFSKGIEPSSASGANAQIVEGQVIFETIPRIDPGQELKLVVQARADTEGPKRFRAEVTSEESETLLVSQETTYFYREVARR